jgi:hypothetical protein
MPFIATLQVGSEGASAGPADHTLGPMPINQMLTVAGRFAYAGPVMVKEVALPADATNDVLLFIGFSNFTCSPIGFTGVGILIDDLRLE